MNKETFKDIFRAGDCIIDFGDEKEKNILEILYIGEKRFFAKRLKDRTESSWTMGSTWVKAKNRDYPQRPGL